MLDPWPWKTRSPGPRSVPTLTVEAVVPQREQLIGTVEVQRLIVAPAVQHDDVLRPVVVEVDHGRRVPAAGELTRRQCGQVELRLHVRPLPRLSSSRSGRFARLTHPSTA